MFATKEDPSNCPFYLHVMVETEFYDSQEDMLSYDINVSIDMLQAQVHQQRIPPKPPQVSPAASFPRMSKEKWLKLSPDACEIWDQLDDHSNSVILAAPKKPPFTPARRINKHEISACDYLVANLHLSTDGKDNDPDYPLILLHLRIFILLTKF